MNKKTLKRQSSVLMSCITCIVILLVICYFVSSNTKGTYSATTTTTYSCSSGTRVNTKYCCPSGYTSGVVTVGSANYCVSSVYSSSTAYANGSGLSCSKTVSSDSNPNSSTWSCESTGERDGSEWIYKCTAVCGVKATNATATTTTKVNAKFYDGSSLKSAKSCTLNSNGRCQITTPSALSKSNYTFKGWSKDNCSTVSAAGVDIYLYDDAKYYACWQQEDSNTSSTTPITYTATFMNQGSVHATRTCNVATKCVIYTPKAVSKTGYTFVGWGNSSCTDLKSAETSISISGNSTFFACYKPNYCYRCFKEANIAGTVPDNYITAYSDDAACNKIAGIDCDNITISCYKESDTTKCSSGTTDDDDDDSGGGGSYVEPDDDPDDEPSDQPSDNPTDEPTNNPVTPDNPTDDDGNVTENPTTGSIAIFVVWVITLATIVYSVWYFKRMNAKNG